MPTPTDHDVTEHVSVFHVSDTFIIAQGAAFIARAGNRRSLAGVRALIVHHEADAREVTRHVRREGRHGCSADEPPHRRYALEIAHRSADGAADGNEVFEE